MKSSLRRLLPKALIRSNEILPVTLFLPAAQKSRSDCGRPGARGATSTTGWPTIAYGTSARGTGPGLAGAGMVSAKIVSTSLTSSAALGCRCCGSFASALPSTLLNAGGTLVRSGSDTEYRGSIRLLGGRMYPLRLEFSKAKQGVDDSKKKKEKRT